MATLVKFLIFNFVSLATFLALAANEEERCNLSAIKEVGIDRQQFIGTVNNSRSQGRAEGLAKSRAVEKCSQANNYLNCRIKDFDPENISCSYKYTDRRDSSGWRKGYLSCSGFAVAIGEKTPEALTKETYNLLICQRINECFLDNLGQLSDRQYNILRDIFELNQCGDT